MSTLDEAVVGVDACPLGWFATVIDADGVRTETYEGFAELRETYSDADRILVDIPLGLPQDERRRCDEDARDLLRSRGISVFYPPCRSAAELSDYQAASDEHRNRIGYGLSQQAHNIGRKILQVADTVGERYDGVVRESHPELCFAALNGQPIAYSKSSD
jgi:predicted RNase H-like nuclease